MFHLQVALALLMMFALFATAIVFVVVMLRRTRPIAGASNRAADR